MKTDLVSSFNDDVLTTIELDNLSPSEELVINIIINEGRRREREEIIAELMKHYNESCCCDTAVFGEHYLSHRQPDNFIDMIRNRPYEH
jgi:hypothetical protein